MPAKQMPVTRRIAPQTTGVTNTAWTSVDAAATAAKAENTRTWPTPRIIRGARDVPTRKPT